MSERTPLYDTAVKSGARFSEEFGWLLPAHYGDVGAEYQSARQQAALFDQSHHGTVEAAGVEAASFLHNLSTNDVKNLPAGAGCEAFLTTGQAKIVAFVLIDHLPVAERSVFHLDAGPGMGPTVHKHLDRYLISEQVELTDRTHDFGQFHLAGPQACAVLERVLGGTLPEMKELQHTLLTVAGTPCRLRRHEPLGLPGYDLIGPRDQLVALWQALVAAGAHPAGLDAYHTLRIEAGTPLYGRDIDDTNLPQEVGRVEHTISFTKGCYIGQETVARIRTYGHVNRLLVGLQLAGREAVPSGAKLFHADKEVGYVTSAAFSPRLGQMLALAYVRRGHQEPGTELAVATADGSRGANVTSLPFAGPA